MKNVKFKTTSAGTYGIAHEGDKLTLKDSVANQLEKQGTVEVLGDAGDDAEESVAPVGSIRITEVKADVQKQEKADKFDPTNEAKNKKAAPKKTSKK